MQQAHLIERVRIQMEDEKKLAAAATHGESSEIEQENQNPNSRRKNKRKHATKSGGIMEEDGDEDDNFTELVSRVEKSMVRCYLNVTSVMNCADGFACVAVSCELSGAKSAGKEIRNLYVGPQHLRIPEDEREWDGAIPFVFV